MKTQTIGPNLGTDGTLNYYSRATQYYRDFNPKYPGGSDWCLEQYQHYKDRADRALTLESTQGTQLFESTNFRPPVFNNCFNQKDESMCVPYLVGCKTGAGWPITILLTPFYRSGGTLVKPEKATASFYGTEQAAARAWWSMQPRFESDISMLNFLFELKDFRDITKYVLNIRHEIYNLGKLAQQLKRRYKGKPTLLAAEARLFNSFVVNPMVNDVMSISDNLAIIVSEAQQKFAENGEQVNKSHYSEVIKDERTVTSYSTYYPCTYDGRTSKSRFTATLTYDYRYKLRSPFEAAMKYWGMNGSFEAIWNGLPFSFLLDYFIKFGQALHFMEKDPNVTTNLHQYCESVLTENSIGTHVGFLGTEFDTVVDGVYHRISASAQGNFPVSVNKSSVYVRRVTSPNKGMALPRVALPSKGQVLNMVALARCFSN